MKATVSVHGRWHAFELANGLHKRRLLGRLLTTYPAFAARRLLEPGVALKTAPWLEVRRHLYDKFSIGGKPDAAIARTFGRFAAGNAIGGADILVGWSAATLEAMAPARAIGMKVVIERGSSHIGHQTNVLRQAHADFGFPYAATEPQIIERELEEYQAADLIAVPSRFAADTFVAQGFDAGKLIVNPYGVDLSRFSPGPREGRIPRVLFAGALGIRKGVPGLLRAFKGLGKLAELHLIGPVEKGFEPILKAHLSENVHVRGALPSAAMAEEFKRADIFCLPSLEEGFPLSLLQAMAAGLAVIATAETGAGDIMIPGQDGLMVNSGDTQSVHEALVRLLENPELRRTLGDAARSRVAGGYSWDDYVDRAVSAYNALLTGE